MAVLARTLIALVLGVSALSGGSIAAAESTMAQAATATPTPTAGNTPTPVPCVVPPFGIQIVLENPSPGDTVLSGTQMVMNGIAYDTGSTSGPGIASVTIYLGDRNAGGLALGIATLGQPNPQAPAGSQLANAGFTLRTTPLPTGSGARTIFVYARSVVGNAEGVLQVPVFLNSQPTPVRGQVPTPVLPPPPACTATPTPAPTSTPTVAPAAAPAAPSPTATIRPTATLATAAAAPPPAQNVVPPVAAPPPAAAPPPPAPAAVAPAGAQATAPRGGGIPAELGFMLLAAGAAIVGGGLALRRRERKRPPTE